MNINPKNENGIRKVVEFLKENTTYLPLYQTPERPVFLKSEFLQNDSLTVKHDSINNKSSKRFSNTIIIKVNQIVSIIAVRKSLKKYLLRICTVPPPAAHGLRT
jgi:hypothetical protein